MASADEIKEAVVGVLRTCYDPEIPIDIYELGLIYSVDADDAGAVVVTMTLTTPMCPVAETLPGEIEARVRETEGVTDASINLVWEPPWDPGMMSEAAKLQLGF